MKKRFTIAGIGLVAGALLVMMTMNVFAAHITEDKAKTIALENAGLKAEEVAFTKAKLDHEDGKIIYEVEFLTNDYKEYEYEINAADGLILSIDCEMKTAYSWDTSVNPASATVEQAKEAAIAHAGQTTETATVVKAETDYDDGRLIYEIEFYTADGKWYEYEITGAGAVAEWKYDASKYSIWKAAAQPLEDAKAAALKRAGLSAADVRWGKVEADYDDGRLIYEGKFYYGTWEYEFEIDAATGAVVDWEVESIYD